MPSIAFWQKRLAEIYPNSDAQKTPDYLMAHLYTSCSELCRILLRDEYDPARDQFVIRAFTWMIALANYFKLNLEDDLIRRYPGVCNYCLYGPCRCDQTGKIALNKYGNRISDDEIAFELEIKYRAVRTAGEFSFDNLVDRVSAIYPGNRTLLKKNGQAYVAGKMLEEGGEVHRSYSGYLRGAGEAKCVGNELADLSGWVVSCWDVEHGKKSLDAEFSRMFIEGCPTCSSPVCACPTYSITRDQEEAIRAIAVELRKLQKIIKNDSAVDEAVDAAESAVAEPTADKRRSMLDKVDGAIRGVKQMNDGSDAVLAISKRVTNAAEFLQGFFP